MKDIDYNNFNANEVLWIARALYNFEFELKYYFKILSIVFPKDNLILKRIDFILKNIKKEQKKIYFIYKDSVFSPSFISYTWCYD